jgi:precorrin-6B methylase 2
MKLTPMTHMEHIGPFLLGTYESELHDWLNELGKERFAQIVDVGAKFGYYAVGLALQRPGVPVIAFDTDPWARRALREMVHANGTPSVRIEGYCSPEWFNRSLVPGALVISDCEGYERDLFPSVRTSAIAEATLLIEVHDEVAPGASHQLSTHFAATHDVRTVEARQVDVPNLPELARLTREERVRAATEVRPHQVWMLFTPKRRGSA